jgi:hypothetical protein
LGEGVLGDFKSPSREAMEDAEEGEVLRLNPAKIFRPLGGIKAECASAIDFKTACGRLHSNDVVEWAWHRHGFKASVVRDKVTLEAGMNRFGQRFVALDKEILLLSPNVNQSAELSFSREKARGTSGEWREACDVDAHLSVQIAGSIRAVDLKTRASVDLEKTDF